MAVHPRPVSAAAAAAAALRDIEVLIGKESESATSVLPTEEGWTVEVEVIDHRHIPPTADMLAFYEVVLDLDGEMLSYRRTRRYRRGSALVLSDDEPSVDGDGQTPSVDGSDGSG
ncbi:gas vesicle protein GvpO [Rhodococcus opacus]|nr:MULTISPECIES: gas vesicle protein GvpO [Rhodococcus]ELB92739.1 gas vesicle synthesis protein [Rhodococcus wratislaviensis IFP 2016]NHU49125.1 gas vesicle protein [Rhodococcus sp. A14]MDI9939557.1 gas vesicle protein GvpO [Rhodococcus sp. IEGM 1351]MDX5965526.1 gas vesicle protein GvpO [Rhodococcus opacus]NKY74033.1 gas vesicle protein [Rhodococcus opacus]